MSDTGKLCSVTGSIGLPEPKTT